LRHGASDREVREVDRRHLNRLRHLGTCQLAEVDSLEVDDAAIPAERPDQLAVAGVHGVDAPGSFVEKHTREATRGGAEVERDTVTDGDGERFERRSELRFAS
jgi:hypothetical protein